MLDNCARDWGRADLAAVFDWCSTDSFAIMPEPPSPFTAAKTDALPNLTPADRAYIAKEVRARAPVWRAE